MMSDDSDIEGLIDGSEEVQENNPSFYRAVDNIKQNALLSIATLSNTESTTTTTSVSFQERVNMPSS